MKYYSQKNVVSSYTSIRYGGKSGRYVYDRERFLIDSLFMKKGFVLDVGCGQGRLSEIISPIENILYGLDSSIEMLKNCSKSYQGIVCGDVNNGLPFAPNSFKYVVCLRFLFHYKNIEHYLSEFKKLSQEYIIFQTYSWSPKMWFFPKILGGKLYIHSEKDIKIVLKKLGLQIIDIKRQFLFSPFIYRFLPYFFVNFLDGIEKKIPDRFKVDVYWHVKKIKSHPVLN